MEGLVSVLPPRNSIWSFIVPFFCFRAQLETRRGKEQTSGSPVTSVLKQLHNLRSHYSSFLNYVCTRKLWQWWHSPIVFRFLVLYQWLNLDTKSLAKGTQSRLLSLPWIHDCQLANDGRAGPADRTRDWVRRALVLHRRVLASVQASWPCFVLQFYRLVSVSSPLFCMQRKKSVNFFLAATVWVWKWLKL